MNELTGADGKKTPREKKKTASIAAVSAPSPISVPKRSDVISNNPVPKPPFWGYQILKNFHLSQIFPYINKTALFKGQWQFKQAGLSDEEYGKILREKVEPLFQTMQEKCIREKILEPKVIVGYYPCCSENDDLIVFDESQKKELTRFTFPRQKKPPFC